LIDALLMDCSAHISYIRTRAGDLGNPMPMDSQANTHQLGAGDRPTLAMELSDRI
jgi:hypothetical protein